MAGFEVIIYGRFWAITEGLLPLEQGANVNDQSEETKETPLHAALCSTDRILYDRVLDVLLSRGANPNLPAADGVVTAGLMRDARTKGEIALHRAAAFGEEGTVKMLLGRWSPAGSP
jgi:ankyrin repeat protein